MPKDAIALLEEDHEKVRGLLEKLTATTERAGKTRRELLEQIERELQAHTTIEEEIFYPAFRQADGKEHAKLYEEAREEHRAVEALVLPDLKDTDPKTAAFSGRAKVVKELIEHHAEEEESEMFPKARKQLTANQLQALGERMAERKKELLSKR